MTYPPTAPDHLSPDERRREVAAILAKGVLRLRSSAQLPPDSADSRSYSDDSPDSRRKALELSATSSPHATRG